MPFSTDGPSGGSRRYSPPVGLPERLVERQLSKGKGDTPQHLRLHVWGKRLLCVAAVLGLLNSGLQLATGSTGATRVLWVAAGAFWAVSGYVALRQLLYLNRRQRQ